LVFTPRPPGRYSVFGIAVFRNSLTIAPLLEGDDLPVAREQRQYVAKGSLDGIARRRATSPAVAARDSRRRESRSTSAGRESARSRFAFP
jgi:hypothetical protein